MAARPTGRHPAPTVQARTGTEQVGAWLIEENERLRASVAEAEAWLRLAKTEQADLRKVHLRTTREATELQTECNKLAAENARLQALVDHPRGPSVRAGREETGQGPTVHEQETLAMKGIRFLKAVAAHRGALAAVAVGALLARDPAVRGLAASAAAHLSPARASALADPASGYLGYARLIHARAAYEEARAAYNANAETLKGDALLEAQDALRVSKARFVAARAAFLPALREACEKAGVTFPSEAAGRLAGTKGVEVASE
jgi:hypothetical protein